jgi:hypothetical protein
LSAEDFPNECHQDFSEEADKVAKHRSMNASHEASCEGTTKAGMTYESSSEELENFGAEKNATNLKKRSKKARLKSQALFETIEQSNLDFNTVAARKLRQ